MSINTLASQQLTNKLVSAKKITREKLDETLAGAREMGESWDQALVKKGLLTEVDMLRFFAAQLHLPLYEDLQQVKVPQAFIDRVDAVFARTYNVIGLKFEDGVMHVATCRPLDLYPLDELASILGMPVATVLAPRVEISALISRAFQAKQDIAQATLEEIEESGDANDLFSAAEAAESLDILDHNKAPVIKLVNQIIFQALRMRASDIHIQPFDYKLQVRYRVDGIMHDIMTPPKKLQEAIISRVKVMGKMDIAERRLPQDGRATIKLGGGGGEVDIRISAVPTAFGERIVMRLLDKTARLYALHEIGLEPDNQKILKSLITYSHGIILLTGPTGSGKTTTLYGSLNHVNSGAKNIITIEDPIEYQIHNVSQIEVNPKKGLTFATGLRSILRQDPNIIMVGEIRDQETALIAMNAALTGHLVFSTLHTNDAPSAVTRLVNMGVEPFLVASSVICVVAQRLVRVICKECKRVYEAKVASEFEDELAGFGLKTEADGSIVLKLPKRNLYTTAANMEWEEIRGQLHKGDGCGSCFNTGYLGRTAIHEIMTVTDRCKDLIMKNASAAEIKSDAVKNGLITLRGDALRKALRGITTLEEVARVTQRDIS